MAFSLSELARSWRGGNTRLQRRVQGWRWQQANHRHLDAATPAGEVVFAIPLVSRRRSEDWEQVERNLAATLQSLQRQTDTRWRAVVCGQDKPGLTDFGGKVRFLPFQGPDVFYDKGAKSAAMLADFLRHEPGAGYYFPLDADDLLHPGLVSHILSDDNRAGYIIDKGYMLNRATMDIASLQPADAAFPEATEFNRNCGSSAALWFDFGSDADFRQVLAKSGNHRKIARNMGYFGLRMRTVPFHAAIYVVNHGENMRKRRGLLDGKLKHFRISPLTDPARLAEIRKTFGLDDAP